MLIARLARHAFPHRIPYTYGPRPPRHIYARIGYLTVIFPDTRRPDDRTGVYDTDANSRRSRRSRTTRTPRRTRPGASRRYRSPERNAGSAVGRRIDTAKNEIRR